MPDLKTTIENMMFRFAIACSEHREVCLAPNFRTFTDVESDAADPGVLLSEIRAMPHGDYAALSAFVKKHSGGNCHLDPCFLSTATGEMMTRDGPLEAD